MLKRIIGHLPKFIPTHKEALKQLRASYVAQLSGQTLRGRGARKKTLDRLIPLPPGKRGNQEADLNVEASFLKESLEDVRARLGHLRGKGGIDLRRHLQRNGLEDLWDTLIVSRRWGAQREARAVVAHWLGVHHRTVRDLIRAEKARAPIATGLPIALQMRVIGRDSLGRELSRGLAWSVIPSSPSAVIQSSPQECD
jgi:hypothetical protein